MWNTSAASSPLPRSGERHHDPDRRVGVLPAIFPKSRRITLDVPGVLLRLVERRRQELQHAEPARNQEGTHAVHGPVREFRRRDAGQHGPGLREGIDAAFVVLRRSQRRPIVVIAAAKPLPVPVAPARLPAARSLAGSARPARPSPLASARIKGHQHGRTERTPASNFRLARESRRDSCRRSSRRSPSTAARAGRRQSAIDRPDAMVEQRPDVGRDRRLAVRLLLVGLELPPFDERHALVENRASPVVATYSATTNGSHSRSSEHRDRRPWPPGSCHQCWTSPSWNCRAAARRTCARVRSGRETAAPGRPGADRGSRTRLRAGSTRIAPRSGR